VTINAIGSGSAVVVVVVMVVVVVVVVVVAVAVAVVVVVMRETIYYIYTETTKTRGLERPVHLQILFSEFKYF